MKQSTLTIGTRTYEVERLQEGIWQLSGHHGTRYRVNLALGYCTCPAWLFSRTKPHTCKHLLKLREELMNDDIKHIQTALAAPFPGEKVHFKAQTVSRGERPRALAVAYIDARDVMDRLDEVLGVTNWQDSYQVMPGGLVICTLSIRIAGEWLSRSDVGGQSEQEDEGDRTKAAFSDALKRAAVKVGVGRYLYRLPKAWVGYDPQRKQLSERPTLPPWALPPSQKVSPRKPSMDPIPRPDEQGFEPDEKITILLADYLAQQIEAKGYSLQTYLAKRKLVSLTDFTFRQYQDTLAAIEKAPTRQAQGAHQ